MKRSSLASIAISILLTTNALAAEVVWKVPTSVPQGSPFYVNFLERFASNVSLLTNERVEIKPYGAGVIVPALEVYKAVKEGTVEAGHSTPSYLVNQDPINSIFAGFPGGMGPENYINWIYEGGGREALSELRASEGLHSLIVGIGATEIFAHANKRITGPEDLKGLKYRTSGPWAEVMREYYGAVPTVVPPGEIYTLLQRKGVDAVEWATPSSNQPEGFHEAAKFIIIPGVHQPTFLWEVVIKKETWNSLPADLKPLLEAAAKLTTYESLSNFFDKDIQAMADYRSGPNEVITLDEAFVKDLSESGQKWIMKKANQQKENGSSEMLELLGNYNKYKSLWESNNDYLIRN